MSLDDVTALAEIFDKLDNDVSVGCVVLTGRGRGFCSGIEMSAMRGPQPDGNMSVPSVDEILEAAEALRRRQNSVPLRLYELSKPTIAAVNGPAAAAGAALACACDIRVASDRALFVPSFASIGMSGDWGATFFFRQILGPSKSRELFFTDRRVVAAEALALGLVDHVYPHESFLSETMALARSIAARPRHTLALMKQVFRAADSEDIRHVMALEALNTVLSSRTEGGRAALHQFVARRRQANTE